MEQQERAAHEGVVRGRRAEFTSQGVTIGDNVLHSKPDANGNIDFFIRRKDGTEANLTGEVLLARATAALTLGQA